MKRGKLGAVLAGIALLSVGGAHWWEILCFFRPDAQIWGRWELVRTSAGAAPEGKQIIVEFTSGRRKITTVNADSRGGVVRERTDESNYSVEGDRVFHHDAAWERKPAPSKFRLEEDGDVLLLENTVGDVARFRKLPHHE